MMQLYLAELKAFLMSNATTRQYYFSPPFDHQVDGFERRVTLTEVKLLVRELPVGYLLYPSVNDPL